ncbi:MAG TPA: malto-oligosyltrehalose synthase [Methyloceanibacter sp.]|nr:malto-oligosyltrehalose synthase [Methyloceanibacter sp.]
MNLPAATYRLQYRNGMTFARAAGLAPYFASLGISHVYGSPIFQAEPGSTHGYDVTDPRAFDKSLGGEEDFARMEAAFRAEGLGLILDFVPNHMSASPRNPFWRDVLEWGQASEYAQFFDNDWSAPKLLVPALARSYGNVLEKGEFDLSFDEEDGGLTFTYGTLKLPLTPPSYGHVLMRGESEDFVELARRFAVATPETAPELKIELAAAARQPGFRKALDAAISALIENIDLLHELHEAQCWRLTHWRAARETLTYRRFFEIFDLVGIKVESQRVFDEIHAKLGELIEKGSIQGLRLDHVDGLADPKAYLERLQKTVGENEPLYLLVEKILGPDEELRADWPVAGTTGYEFIRALAGLFVDARGTDAMTRAYDRFLGEDVAYRSLVVETKRRMLTRNLAGELDRLKDLAGALATRHLSTRDFGTDTLRRATIELIAALPVYRTYIDISGAQEKDRATLDSTLASAKATREVEDEDAIDFLGRVLTLDFEAPEDQGAALEFATRLQQTSGPVMAKAVEDTVFYRYNRLIALNEVGGEPDQFGGPVAAFHEAMERRQQRQAAGLSATATHDTKRGEDARARLYALSEMPDAWGNAVHRWAGLTAELHSDCGGLIVPEPETEWMFYQALAGAWPLDLKLEDGQGLSALSDRMAEFMLKAVREAKVHTSWTGQNEDYEEAVRAFTTAALDPTRARAFLRDFVAFCQPIFVAGALNSLAQTAIKLTAPGVPDIYQGTEFWDFSLVDPDNRRPVDFDTRRSELKKAGEALTEDLVVNWRDGAIKMRLLKAGLDLRKTARNIFSEGDYLPVQIEGPAADHAVAFARLLASSAVVVIAPRLCLELLEGQDGPLVPRSRWGDTIVRLPKSFANQTLRDILTGRSITGEAVELAEILETFPVGVFSSQVNPA